MSAGTPTESPSEPSAEPIPQRLENEPHAHFYSVGTGTRTLVECPGPDARPIIVDCGSLDARKGDHALSDAELEARITSTLGERSTDVVLSHSDEDHVSLIPEVLDGVQVAAVWQGDDLEDYPDYLKEWMSGHQRTGAAVHRDFEKDWHNDGQPIANGLDCGTASSYVLTVNSGRDSNDDNGDSLVLMLEYGAFRVIFTGDATGRTESAAMSNFERALRATVLTASHHGASSKGSNSERWADETRPAVVVYSSGKRYGHPTCEARNRLDDTLAEVTEHKAVCGTQADDGSRTELAEYMTRVSGTISVTTNGRSPLRLDCEADPGCAGVYVDFE